MRLTHLALTNFRNFSRLDVDVPGGVILLVGDNAQGKTSLLEAVYYLATLTSFHASSDRQLINYLLPPTPPPFARIVADFQRLGRSHRLEIRLIQENGNGNGGTRLRKEIYLDGVQIKSTQAVGQFNAVMFLPQMMNMVDGAPEERRRYLNLALAQASPGYTVALTEFNRALTQRNALLKQLGERGGDLAQLDFWDNLLSTSGAQLIQARIRAVAEIERLAAQVHRQLTNSKELLRLSYRPSYDPVPGPPGQFSLGLDVSVDRSGVAVEQIQQGYKQRLLQLRGEEVQRGVTTLGPHRDDLRFLSNRIDLGEYGSRGQIRTLLLALKLAEVSWMKSKTHEWPVLLLDEVLAELDAQRRADLLARLAEAEQALLTTTDLDLFAPDFVSSSTRWRIHEGYVS
ncbi:MAG: DNA replication/repair protein RecF [Anaerolineales bacterium]|jgi:DNA replication and repair protein RecF|nr:DNA replication/repair protein RecF [Anaerolineales bacterium]